MRIAFGRYNNAEGQKGGRDARLGAVTTMALMVAGCSAGNDVPVAQQAITIFHHQLDAGQFAAIYNGSSADMKSASGGGDLTQLLAAVHRKLGAFQSGSAIGWNDNYGTGGHFVTINYSAKYARGDASENFVYRLSNDKAALAGYHIASNALVIN
jgi:hypothetical protein